MNIYKPTFSAQLPAGWRGKESITLVSPTGDANVIASTEAVDPAWNTKHYAESQVTLAQEQFSEYRQILFRELKVFGGLPGYVHQFEWTSHGMNVRQMQLYYVSKGTAWLATATTASRAYENNQSELLQVLDGLSGPPMD